MRGVSRIPLYVFCLSLILSPRASEGQSQKGWSLSVVTIDTLHAPDFIQPQALAVGPLGQLYLADLGRGTVIRLDAESRVQFEFETPHRQPDLQPLDLEVTGFQVYVLDAESNSLLRFSDEGSFLDVLRSFREEGIDTPRALSVDGAGRVLLANASGHSARIINELQLTETLIQGFGPRAGELSYPSGAVFAIDGSFYIADTGNGRLQHFSGVGNLQAVIEKGLSRPGALAVGRSGELYVIDSRENSIRLYVQDHLQSEIKFEGFVLVDVCVYQDHLWVLSEDPPALIRLRVFRGE